MSLERQIGTAQVVCIMLTRLQKRFATELHELEEKPRHTPAERSRMQHLRETLQQIDRGVYPTEGTDPVLDALVRHPDVVSLRLQAPGLQSVARLLERLERQKAEEAAQATDDALGWPRPFRYIGKPNRAWRDGRYLRPGDVVDLTKSQAQNWSDIYEAVRAPSVGGEPDAAA
jgi:hypothetical protein